MLEFLKESHPVLYVQEIDPPFTARVQCCRRRGCCKRALARHEGTEEAESRTCSLCRREA